ncbi:MAG: sulfatase [Armatimonadetes bacterium]|nr:sulfatase [Armatimonadota bacterium]
MNVIVICLDTLRWDHLGCYREGRAQTPALDAFARGATCFDAAYCASFPTVPMRTDAFTGNVNWPRYGWKKLGEDETTLTEYLREAGYHTAFIHDTWNMVPTGFGRAFDDDILLEAPAGWEANIERVVSPVPLGNMRQGGHGFLRDRARVAHCTQETDWFVAQTMLAASRWLEENRKRERFFLWVDSFEIHEDWYAPDFYTELYSPGYEGLDYSYPNYGHASLYRRHELRRLQARYAAEVTLTDRWVGHLLRTIELAGLLDRSLVVIISDHGMYLGEHNRVGKHSVDSADPWPIYDEVGKLPLLIRLPGRSRPKRTAALTQPADLAPTILDACGLRPPKLVGKSLLPVLRGERAAHHKLIFTSCHSGRGEGRIEYLPSCITVTGPRWTFVTGCEPWSPVLCDRRIDPRQMRNVIDQHPRVAAGLCDSLVGFMRSRGADEGYIQGFARV